MKKFTLPVLFITVGLLLAGCAGEDAVTSFEPAAQSFAKVNGGTPHPAVIPPQARPHGQSYGEWSVAYWQWLWAIPAASSPVLDETGEFVAAGQSGSVWFLARTFGGTAVRTAWIPSGKMLFIDVAGWFFAPALGEISLVDSVVVRWPSGIVDVISGVAADKVLEVLEGGGSPLSVHSTPPGAEVGRPFPNPAAETCMLAVKTDRAQTISMQLIDGHGRPIRLQEYQLTDREQQLEIELRDVPNGFYYLQLIFADGSVLQPLVVLR